MKRFLAGLGSGVALGVLLAPRSGSEMREQLRSEGRVLAGRVKQRTRRLGQKLTKQFQGLQKQAAGLTESAGSQLKTAVQTVASKAGVGALAKLTSPPGKS